MDHLYGVRSIIVTDLEKCLCNYIISSSIGNYVFYKYHWCEKVTIATFLRNTYTNALR